MKPKLKNPTIFVVKKKRFKETCFTQSFRTFSMFFGAMIAFGVLGLFGDFGVFGGTNSQKAEKFSFPKRNF